MKNAFAAAQQELQSVQKDDTNLQDEISLTRAECSKQSGDILESLSAVNNEVKSVREALQSTQISQQELQATVHTLLLERDMLLDELLKTGAISRNIR
jgi:predicted  nucleic acid-binding Zn-ribbon protein